ncbi:uncharacterized protein LOC111897230 [Lactuca sativa]|uniref:uncharacterized protein LOC111897230 n=1 Tax=Lactuca sativa TaxID=4236 RepID=UPI0022B0050E|nr:uncharacterized protein LOC111897230 [Lactuca sativa]
MAAMMAKLDSLDRRTTKMDQTIHAIRVGCEYCRGPHLMKDCDLDENGNKKAQVLYSSGDRYDENWRKPKKEWLPYEEYKRAKEEKYKQKERGYYQMEEPVMEKKADLEEMFTRFIAVSEKRHNHHDDAIQETRNMLRNQQESILNIEKQLVQLAHQVNERRPGQLPSNTENNPRMENVNVVTSNYGEIFTPAQKISKVNIEKAEESALAKPDQTRRVPLMDSTSPCADDKTVIPSKPYNPPLPFPIRAMPVEKVKVYRVFMEHVRALQVNVPFVETMIQTPNYFNLLKGLFAAKKDLAKVAETVLSKLPEKKGNPGSIIIPCQFGDVLATQALTDSGASINLMPFSFFKKLHLPERRPVNMKIDLADKTTINPRGVCEDLLIKVDKKNFPWTLWYFIWKKTPKFQLFWGDHF